MRLVGFSILFYYISISQASFHEQYRVPKTCTEKWESYVYNNKEYIIQNLGLTWENAKILCRGHQNGTLAILDTKEKAEFVAEILSESQLPIESAWVAARRSSSDDPGGYRWPNGVELPRTSMDILSSSDSEGEGTKHFPLWLNRTHVPVPEGGADCVSVERVHHDHPVFVDLQCLLERPFICERDIQEDIPVKEMKVVRCHSGIYRLFDGRLDWHQAAAYCVLNKMSLANIGSMRCLKKLGMTMLKTRPSVETAWIGARGELGHWTWVDSGVNIFQLPAYTDATGVQWPPIRDRSDVKQSGCLQLDRHATHPPIFMEARCERKMRFICYQSGQINLGQPLSDDNRYYVLIRQRLYWQHAYDNCLRMNGSLASIDSSDTLTQLLLAMGEDRDEPIKHIWISGRLNMSKDSFDAVTYYWQNPYNGRKIHHPLLNKDSSLMSYMPPWLEEEFSMDSSCLNLDRQEHLNGLVYGMPCDTPQYSICVIEKALRQATIESTTESS
ncbi:hypothetical protein ACJJTC_011035 [Scirpophaga incertulas]